MTSGLHKFDADVQGRRNPIYATRRHIHMIEKGLTMRPRRNLFALDYIWDAVENVAVLCDTSEYGDANEMLWMRTVLTCYFDVVDKSHPVVARAHKSFCDGKLEYRKDPMLGPYQPPAGTHFDIGSLYELARHRQSVRWFVDSPLPYEAIVHALRIAQEAPSACNRQPYQFRIINSDPLLSQITAIPMGTNGYAHNIPSLAVVIGDQSAFQDARDRHLIYIDASLAAMSFILGLQAQGIASCCINWPDLPARERKIRTALGLLDHQKVVMLIAFGYAEPGTLAPASVKKSLDLLAAFN